MAEAVVFVDVFCRLGFVRHRCAELFERWHADVLDQPFRDVFVGHFLGFVHLVGEGFDAGGAELIYFLSGLAQIAGDAGAVAVDGIEAGQAVAAVLRAGGAVLDGEEQVFFQIVADASAPDGDGEVVTGFLFERIFSLIGEAGFALEFGEAGLFVGRFENEFLGAQAVFARVAADLALPCWVVGPRDWAPLLREAAAWAGEVIDCLQYG